MGGRAVSALATYLPDYLVVLLLGVFAGSVLSWRIHDALRSIRLEAAGTTRKPSRNTPRRFSALRSSGRYWNLHMHRGGGFPAGRDVYGLKQSPSEISSLMQLAVDSVQPHDRERIVWMRRYAAVEAVNALLYILTFHVYGWSTRGLAVMGLMSVFVAVAVIDLEERIIPDGITIVGLLIGLILGPLVFGQGILDSVLGVLVGGGLFYAIAVISRGGMGGGDIKFIAMTGAFVGWKGVLIAIFAGSLAGAVVGIGLMVFKGMGRKTPIPFGPFLVFGAMLALLYGPEIADWYACCSMP